jgi:MoxR-like ATPase
MLKVLVGYPNSTEEFVIVERMTGALQAIQRVINTEQLLVLQRAVDDVYVDPVLIEYAVKLVSATRDPGMVGLEALKPLILFGASPRASINLILAARALAFVRGRSYVLPQDTRDVAPDVIRHRLVLSYEALADNISSDDLLQRILKSVPVPEAPLHERRFQPGATSN